MRKFSLLVLRLVTFGIIFGFLVFLFSTALSFGFRLFLSEKETILLLSQLVESLRVVIFFLLSIAVAFVVAGIPIFMAVELDGWLWRKIR